MYGKGDFQHLTNTKVKYHRYVWKEGNFCSSINVLAHMDGCLIQDIDAANLMNCDTIHRPTRICNFLDILLKGSLYENVIFV